MVGGQKLNLKKDLIAKNKQEVKGSLMIKQWIESRQIKRIVISKNDSIYLRIWRKKECIRVNRRQYNVENIVFQHYLIDSLNSSYIS